MHNSVTEMLCDRMLCSVNFLYHANHTFSLCHEFVRVKVCYGSTGLGLYFVELQVYMETIVADCIINYRTKKACD